MVAVSRSMTISFTKDFQEIYPDFVKLCDKSPRFKAMLAKQINQCDGLPNKNLDKGRDSARMRFAVMICFKELIKEQKEIDAAIKKEKLVDEKV